MTKQEMVTEIRSLRGEIRCWTDTCRHLQDSVWKLERIVHEQLDAVHRSQQAALEGLLKANRIEKIVMYSG